VSASPHDWDSSYTGQGPAPWDIGRPQAPFVALADRGQLTGDLLDAGCGTGEHALLAAASGAHAWGVDLSGTAIGIATQKAADRGLVATFRADDILRIALPKDGFDVVVDSGLFHVFTDDERMRYTTVLANLLRPTGSLYLMCFSDRQPGDWGPRRVTQDEIRNTFADGWSIESIEPATFEINPVFGSTTVAAWLATIRRV